MAVWCVTGKLGAGKTLVSVSRIYDALVKGKRVATNLDLNMPALCGWQSTKARVVRIPDKPTRQHLDALGVGNPHYDESKNGLLVLDECGSWFNAREWNNPERRAILDWLLHARKLGWDIIFIIQDASAIDKQARKMFLEHIVYCRRMDRMSIPVITALMSVAGFSVRLPRVHIGYVTYGDQQHSPVVDRWVYRGTHLFKAYDTKQAFSDHYPHGLYSYLPAVYWKRTPRTTWSLINIMKLTRIYFRRLSRVVAFSLGMIITGAGAYGLMKSQQTAHIEQVQELIAQVEESASDPNQVSEDPATPGKPPPLPWWKRSYTVGGYFRGPAGDTYILNDSQGRSIKAELFKQRGFSVRGRGPCEVIWVNPLNSDQRGAAYCGGFASDNQVSYANQ